jgi:hypothetical protein
MLPRAVPQGGSGCPMRPMRRQHARRDRGDGIQAALTGVQHAAGRRGAAARRPSASLAPRDEAQRPSADPSLLNDDGARSDGGRAVPGVETESD